MDNTTAAPTTTTHDHYSSRVLEQGCPRCALALGFRPLDVDGQLERLAARPLAEDALGHTCSEDVCFDPDAIVPDEARGFGAHYYCTAETAWRCSCPGHIWGSDWRELRP